MRRRHITKNAHRRVTRASFAWVTPAGVDEDPAVPPGNASSVLVRSA
jgi:hypothetical protein